MANLIESDRDIDMRFGRIKWFKEKLGYGFIYDFKSNEDVYVSRTEIGDIQHVAGDLVCFISSPSRKKPGTLEATSVKPISDEVFYERVLEKFPRKLLKDDWWFGKVQFFDQNKGFGFATLLGEGEHHKQDVYLNEKELRSDPPSDFELILCRPQKLKSSKKAPSARDICKVKTISRKDRRVTLASLKLGWSDLNDLRELEFFNEVTEPLVRFRITLLDDHQNDFEEFVNILRFSKLLSDKLTGQSLHKLALKKADEAMLTKLFAAGYTERVPTSILNPENWPLADGILLRLVSVAKLSQSQLSNLWSAHITQMKPSIQNNDAIQALLSSLECRETKDADIKNWAKRLIESLPWNEFTRIRFLFDPTVPLLCWLKHQSKLQKLDYTECKRVLCHAKRTLEASDLELIEEKLIQLITDDTQTMLFTEGILDTIPRSILKPEAWPLEVVTLDAILEKLPEHAHKLLEGHIQAFEPNVVNSKMLIGGIQKHIEDDSRDELIQKWKKRLPPDAVIELIIDQYLTVLDTNELVSLALESSLDRLERLLLYIAKDPAVLAIVLTKALKACPTITDICSRDRLDMFAQHWLENRKEPVPAGVVFTEINRFHLQTLSWLADKGSAPPYSYAIQQVKYLSDEDQVTFIRKCFREHQLGNLSVSEASLRQLIDGDTKVGDSKFQVNLTLRLIIESISFFARNPEGMLREAEILQLVYDQALRETDHRSRLIFLPVFEECAGRMEAYFDAPDDRRISPTHSQNGMQSTSFEISFEYDPELVKAVKQIPGRKYDASSRVWIVPKRSEIQIKEFARRYRFAYSFGKDGFRTRNKHLFQFSRGFKPNHVRFCEGRESLVPHKFHERQFWWCANEACFENCESEHEANEWRKYSLLDMLRILGIGTDEIRTKENRIIKHGRYYQLAGLVNRTELLLEYLFCRDCNALLMPKESSHFAHYRVTRFECESVDCEFDDEVYLHHCFSKKCGEIIDSRDSAKCPNGWHICAKCGSCCSNEVFNRRKANLEKVGYGPSYSSTHGHLEQRQWFCYRCGGVLRDKDAPCPCQKIDEPREIPF